MGLDVLVVDEETARGLSLHGQDLLQSIQHLVQPPTHAPVGF